MHSVYRGDRGRANPRALGRTRLLKYKNMYSSQKAGRFGFSMLLLCLYGYSDVKRHFSSAARGPLVSEWGV